MSKKRKDDSLSQIPVDEEREICGLPKYLSD